MKTGINIEAPRVDAEAGAAVAGAICELLEVAARTRTSDTLAIAALDALKMLSPTGASNMTISGCHVEGDRIIP